MTVTQLATGSYQIVFGGSLAGAPQTIISPQIVVGTPGSATVTGSAAVAASSAIVATSTATVTTSSLGVLPLNTLVLNTPIAEQTEFKLTFNGSTTGLITYTGTAADATAIQNALDSLASIGGLAPLAGYVNVTQIAPGSYQIVFEGGLSGAVNPTVSVTIVTQELVLSSGVAGETTFNLKFNGAKTGSLTYLGTAADATTVQAALNALSTIGGVGGSVTVTQGVQELVLTSAVSMETEFTLTFNGDTTSIIEYTGTAADAATIQNCARCARVHRRPCLAGVRNRDATGRRQLPDRFRRQPGGGDPAGHDCQYRRQLAGYRGRDAERQLRDCIRRQPGGSDPAGDHAHAPVRGTCADSADRGRYRVQFDLQRVHDQQPRHVPGNCRRCHEHRGRARMRCRPSAACRLRAPRP